MAAGGQINRPYLDAKVAALAVQFRTLARQAQDVGRGLTGFDVAAYQSLGYTPEEAAVLMDGLVAAQKIMGLAYGQDTLPVATNLAAVLDKLSGID